MHFRRKLHGNGLDFTFVSHDRYIGEDASGKIKISFVFEDDSCSAHFSGVFSRAEIAGLAGEMITAALTPSKGESNEP